jgi:PadR family transcriptional regulator, regulatory protein AphA
MCYRLMNKNNQSFLECLPGKVQLASERDVLDLLTACGEYGTNQVMLHSANLTDDFYRLSTGLAGMILQKFSNYRIRAAAILTPELVNQGRFREMVSEANRGNQFHVYYEREAAERWLTQP